MPLCAPMVSTACLLVELTPNHLDLVRVPAFQAIWLIKSVFVVVSRQRSACGLTLNKKTPIAEFFDSRIA
jgi:hypothetical protein